MPTTVDVTASWRAALIGALVAGLATLPGLGVGTLWDNSETAYGEVAREVLLTHQVVVLHLNGAPWFVQPPLYFWIAAAFAKVLGVSAFALRLPSALATIAMAAAVGYVVARIASSRAALLAATILSTSLMQAVVGRLAIMDALLDLAVAMAVLAFFRALRSGGRGAWYAAWTALGFGLLAKGVVAPVVTALVIVPWALWEKRMRRPLCVPGVAPWLAGVALCAAIVAPWAIALWRAAGWSPFAELVGHYTFGRYLGTIENQSGPIWYYVPVVILGFFPWFAFLVPALAEAWRDALWRENGSVARLALAWSIVPFVFFSFASTKLPNYIALELPAFAILVAVWFDRVVERCDRRRALAWAAIVPVTIVGLGFAMWAFSHANRLTAALAATRDDFLALGSVILLGSIACFALLVGRRTSWLAPFALGASSVLVMLIIAVWGEPIVERFKPIPQLAAAIDRERRPGDAVGIQGVSGGNALLFYTHPRIAKLAGPDDAENASAADPRATICAAARMFVITSRKRPSPDPTYGRRRQLVATSNNDVLFLYDGPPCDERTSRR
ncbi:MAG: glycosyltransferase family 39 protein [Candidatus Eremiobacteraeota bacterium]|nr:glycosyltransferase family 39 protein [Candidatus Eremiobacteraeota bacterium]